MQLMDERCGFLPVTYIQGRELELVQLVRFALMREPNKMRRQFLRELWRDRIHWASAMDPDNASKYWEGF